MEIAYTAVAGADEIPVGSYRILGIGGRTILVAHLADGFHAVENRCSHAAGSFSGPIVKGALITCPLHGAQFDLRTGAPKSAPAFRGIPIFATRLRDGKVEVAVPQKPPAARP